MSAKHESILNRFKRFLPDTQSTQSSVDYECVVCGQRLAFTIFNMVRVFDTLRGHICMAMTKAHVDSIPSLWDKVDPHKITGTTGDPEDTYLDAVTSTLYAKQGIKWVPLVSADEDNNPESGISLWNKESFILNTSNTNNKIILTNVSTDASTSDIIGEDDA